MGQRSQLQSFAKIKQILEKGEFSSFREGVVRLTRGIGTLGVDTYLRYQEVARLIIPDFVLDVGAGGRSQLLLHRPNIKVVSLDLKSKRGVDVVADTRFLPFREKCFQTVIAVDMLEHLNESSREKAIMEMTRVANRRILVHMPLQDSKDHFLGKEYDSRFSIWHKRAFGKPEKNVEEHLIWNYWSPNTLKAHKFELRGSRNTRVWIISMVTAYGFFFPLGTLPAWILYGLFLRWLDQKPPYWGALASMDLKSTHASLIL